MNLAEVLNSFKLLQMRELLVILFLLAFIRAKHTCNTDQDCGFHGKCVLVVADTSGKKILQSVKFPVF